MRCCSERFCLNVADKTNEFFSDFEAIGFTQEKLEAFKADLASFSTIKSDAALREDWKRAHKTEIGLASELRKKLQDLFLMATAESDDWEEMGLGNFNLGAIGSENNADLAKRAEDMVSELLSHPTLQVWFGSNDGLDQELLGMANGLRSATSATSSALGIRRDATQKRNALRKRIYKQFAYICFLGKRLYYQSYPNKYKFFVIYRRAPLEAAAA